MKFLKNIFSYKNNLYKGIEIKCDVFLDKKLYEYFEQIYKLSQKYFLAGNFINITKENVTEFEGPSQISYKIEFYLSDIPVESLHFSYENGYPKKIIDSLECEKIPMDIKEEMAKDIRKIIPISEILEDKIQSYDSCGCLYIRINRIL